MTDVVAIASAAVAYFETLQGVSGWKRHIIRAFAEGAYGSEYGPPAPYPGTTSDVLLNEVTAQAYKAGKEFAK